jgi:hypothetical protein
LPWPARSTGCALLKAQGLVRARPRRPRGHASASPLMPATAPNDLWTTDFKGEFRLGDGQYCYPLTLRDAASRYVLRCTALTTKAGDRIHPPVAVVGMVDSPRDPAGTDRAGASGTKRVARTIPSRTEGRNHAAPGAAPARTATAVLPLLCRIQSRAAARSAAGSAARQLLHWLAASLPDAVAPRRVPRTPGDPACRPKRANLVARSAASSDRGVGGRRRGPGRGRRWDLDRLPCRRAFGTVRRTDAHRDGAGAGDVNSGAWKLPELWTHRTRPQLLGKRADRVFHSYHTPSTTCYPCLQTNLLPMSPAVPAMGHGQWKEWGV